MSKQSVTANKVFTKNSDIASRTIEDETILLPTYKNSDDINCIYTLNESAAFVWGLINGKNTVKQIKDKVAKKFDSSVEEIDKEISVLFKELKKIKAIT